MGAASVRINCRDIDDVVSEKFQAGQVAVPDLRKEIICIYIICVYICYTYMFFIYMSLNFKRSAPVNKCAFLKHMLLFLLTES